MATEYKWEQKTLGQNKKIQEIVASAAKASELLNANTEFAKGGIKAAQLFLTTVMSPKVIILNTIADTIDTFVEDFLGTGFYILEVVPEGSETVPTDADGNPITLALAPVAVAANYSTALALGIGTEFKEWTKAYFGKDPNDLTEGDLKEVPQGNSEPIDKRVNDANSDRIAPAKGVFGFPAMTPPQVISTMIAAIDDPLDDQRPTFSSNVEVGAIIMIMGFSNLEANIGDFRATIQAMVDFFGGEQGIFTEGFKKIGKVIEAALGQYEDPTKHDVTVTLKNVSGVYGNEDDLENLKKLGVPPNFKANFTVGDFVVGPRLKYGARAIGYISKADEKDIEEDEFNRVYVTQKVTIRGATETDYLAWQNLSSGSQIQRAHFYKSRRVHVDQNTSEPIIGGYSNDFKLFDELPFTWNDPTVDDDGKPTGETKPKLEGWEGKAVTKVERASESAKEGVKFDPFLSPVGEPEVYIEKVGQEKISQISATSGMHLDAIRNIVVTKDIMGTVFEQTAPQAPHPNFKNATLEDLIGDFKTFFGAIQTFTNQLRDIAKDTTAAIDDLVQFLNESIAQLDKINEDLQKVLKLFTIGLPDAGIYVLAIPPDGVAGVEGLKAAIQGAKNQPSSTLSHSVGFMMVGDKKSTELLTDLLVP